jgi:hypothetical protein
MNDGVPATGWYPFRDDASPPTAFATSHCWIEAAQARWREKGDALQPMTAIGVDVAQGGADMTLPGLLAGLADEPRVFEWPAIPEAYPSHGRHLR